MWHDNSGTGKFASWFLNSVIIKDVQTNEKWFFIANSWLAVEKGSGAIDRVVPAASQDEILRFKNRFHVMTHRSMSDEHIWLSVFKRPPRSRFSRVERVSCCMVMLCLSMAVSAMWYGRVPSRPTNGLRIGLLSFSIEEVFLTSFNL